MDSSEHEEFTDIQEVFLEFRAGKMLMDGRRVIPDSRKGLVRVGKGTEGLVHIQWLDRSLNVVEDDQVVFPETAVFEHVHQSSGRIYVMKFLTDDRKFFFWMQEPKEDGDSQICSTVNHYLNLPIVFPGEEYNLVFQPSSDDEVNISSRAGNLVDPMIGVEASSGPTSAGPVKLEDLQRILSSIRSTDEASDPDAGLGLGDILRPDLIRPLLGDLPLDQQLTSHLPEGPWTPRDFIELLQSPPFRQQLDSFTYVLRTGQVDLTQFGIDPSKYKFTVPSFLEALEDSVPQTSNPEDDLKSQSSNKMDES